MSDDHSFEKDDDDPLARIRARFEQASERILSGSDDMEPPEPARTEPARESEAHTATIAPGSDDLLDDFGEIDIQDDPMFSLDFEHGVSAPPRRAGYDLVGDVDLSSNLGEIRSDSPSPPARAIDPDRHLKHRTRGVVGDAADPETGTQAAQEAAPAAAALPRPETATEQTKKNKKEKKRRTREERIAVSSPPVSPVSRWTEPDPDRSKKSRVGLIVTAIVLLAAGGAAAFVLFAPGTVTTEPATITTAPTTFAPPTPSAGAAAALEAFGFTRLQVGVDETGVATIVGIVRSAREPVVTRSWPI